MYCEATHKGFLIPSDADRVAVVDCSTGTVRVIGPALTQWTHNKWQNGFLSEADKCVYAIPLNATSVLRIDPLTEEVSLLDSTSVASGSAVVRDLRETVLLQNQDPFAGGDKWEGGVVGADGSLYCMPMRSKTVLRITGAREESLSWTCAP